MKNSSTNLLFIHHGGGIGGAPLSLLNTILTLDRRKYNIKVLLLVDSPVIELFLDNGIDAHVVKNGFYEKKKYYFNNSEIGLQKPYRVLSYLKVLKYWILSAKKYAPRVLKKESPDIVHLNSSLLTDWCYAAKSLNIKNIIHIREPIATGRFGIRRSIMRSLIGTYADHIIAISEDNASRINLPHMSSTIYNDVRFSDHTENCRRGTPSCFHKKTLLYAGGISSHKGFNVIVNALKYLDNDVRIIFVGNYDVLDRNVWQPSYWRTKNTIKLIEIIKSHKNAEYIGEVSDVGLYIALSVATISAFTFPHFSRLILESYAQKKAVITSDVVGMSEVVKNDKSGLMFDNGDSRSLAQAINNLCQDYERAKAMGEYGYQMYIDNFSNIKSNKVGNLYAKILE
jgi:glycosyltransferase involved in cell wall biosynthesis